MTVRRRIATTISILSLIATVGCIALSGNSSARARSPRVQPKQISPGTNRPMVEPYKASRIYKVGEKVGWNLSLTPGSPDASFSYQIQQDGLDVIASGTLTLTSAHPTKIETTLSAPAMLDLQLKPAGKPAPGGPVQDEARTPLIFGAAVEPTKITPSAPTPPDFDSFWNSKIKWLHTVPMNPVLTPIESGQPDVDLYTIQMDHVNNTHVYGQIAKPHKPGKYPAMLILQWASPPYPLDKNWVIWRAKAGWLTLNIEPHDTIANGSKEYYASLPAAIKNYTQIGMDDREKNYFLEMYLRDYRAVDYLVQCPEWDGKIIVVTGGSMGGQQSLCVAGLHPRVTHVLAEEPAGCDLSGFKAHHHVGYPFYPQGNPAINATAPYFDAVNFASHIKATSLIGMGFIDNVAPPTGIWTAFNQIKGPKEAAPCPEAPHNNLATQEQMRPYRARAEQWLEALIQGHKIVPNPRTSQP